MRTYKFRGLPFEDEDIDNSVIADLIDVSIKLIHIDKNKFVYGDLSTGGNERFIVATIAKTKDGYEVKRIIKVRPETVGQYVGLNDKNNVEIFEGDFVRDNFNRTLKIFYGNHKWRVEAMFSKTNFKYADLFEWECDDLEIIGNEHSEE